MAKLTAAQQATEQAVLDAVAVAWHELAPKLVNLAQAQAKLNVNYGDPLYVWAQAQHLLNDAMALPEAHHKCAGVTCKFGYAHAAGF
jgi:hypothetical protein